MVTSIREAEAVLEAHLEHDETRRDFRAWTRGYEDAVDECAEKSHQLRVAKGLLHKHGVMAEYRR